MLSLRDHIVCVWHVTKGDSLCSTTLINIAIVLIDNIFVLKHLVQRERRRKDKKIYSIFVDLKAAFDNMERENMENIGGKSTRRTGG